jgi:AmpD protein
MRAQKAIDFLLVIHNISLPPACFGTGKVQQFFQNRLTPMNIPICQHQPLTVSAHLFVERDGAVTQFVSLRDRAWHAGVSSFDGREGCNDFSIGIELEGTDDLPYTDAQYVLEQLTRHIRVPGRPST